MRRRRLARCAAAAALLVLTLPAAAAAQGYVPPAHTWTVTFVSQTVRHDGHIIGDGTSQPLGKSTTIGNDVVLGYALTDRLSFDVGLPYIFAKYRGPDSGPPFAQFLPVDSCFCYHSGFEDFTGTVHYNVMRTNGGIAITPSVAFEAPSHSYDHVGEAVVGRDLREVRLGVDAAAPVPFNDRIVMQAAYSYAFVQRVLGIPNNRSNATIEGDYRLTRRLTVSGLLLWQHTHGGLQVTDFYDFVNMVITNPDEAAQHDRLLQDNAIRVGGGASYSFGPWDASAVYIGYTHGSNTHIMHALTLSMTWTKHD